MAVLHVLGPLHFVKGATPKEVWDCANRDYQGGVLTFFEAEGAGGRGGEGVDALQVLQPRDLSRRVAGGALDLLQHRLHQPRPTHHSCLPHMLPYAGTCSTEFMC